MGDLSLQWQPGQPALRRAAGTRRAARAAAPWRTVPAARRLLATGAVPASIAAAVPHVPPSAPALSGFRCLLQALARTNLACGLRLSTDQSRTVR